MTPHAVVIANFVQACCWQLDRAPQAGETRRAYGFHSEAGGKGLNVAIALQRLGARVTPILAHGRDAAGDQLRALLQAEGLPLDHVHALPHPSGWGAGFIEPDGQCRIAVFPGANDHLSAAHVGQAAHAIAQATVVYGQFEVALDAVVEALRLARQAGVLTVLNPSPWQAVPATLREVVHTYLVNESEAEQLLDQPWPARDTADWPATLAHHLQASVQAFWQRHPGAQALVVTLGEHGCLAWTRGQAHALVAPGLPAAPGGDAVGCGDAFAAGFCWARAQGADLPAALALGNQCGAHLASHVGVLQALPDQAWLSRVMPPG
ncbi:PfkB family carbohydrate kinase [Comamonas serinivorans]|nr:PfkB family carbohydrate kinase [Comamonas serinivorans]